MEKQHEKPNSGSIKLTRPGYYTIPAVNEIDKYRNEMGVCLMQGFTIGRYGYGNIYFPDAMDVSNLNLDELVDFDYGQIVVKSEKTKGLNRRAQVTLDGIWPHCPETGKVVTDTEYNFHKQLKILSEKQNANFVDYRPDTGSWVFMVEHFSKFSFTEVEDEQLTVELAKQQKEKEELERLGRGLGGVHVLVHHPLDGFGIEHEESAKGLMKSTFFDTASCISVKDVSATATSDSRSVCIKAPKREPPKYFRLLNRHGTVPPERSLLNRTRTYMDMSVFKGLSFKVGWARGFTFMTITGKTTLAYSEIKSNAPQFMDMDEHLKIVFEESTVTESPVGPPSFAIKEDGKVLIRHQNVARSISDAFYYNQVWDLCVTFWGPNATTPTARRRSFSKFLEDAAVSHLKTELQLYTYESAALIKNLFIYLSAHKLQNAVALAEEEGLNQLAGLISHASANDSAKQLVRNQLEQWRECGAIDHIDSELMKVYMLLGGVPVMSGLNVCDGLDWKRALAIHLWYVCPPGVSLLHAVQAYQDAFAHVDYAARPNPEHYDENSTYDVLYQIMLLFQTTTGLETIVNPMTHTDDALDYRLSWLLLQTLLSLQLGRVSQNVVDAATISFASQLEHMREWKWAMFVLLFLKDQSFKQKAVVDILERNLDTSVDDSLVNDFKIPSQWVHAVLAEKTLGRHIVTYRHRIFAKQWRAAHDIAVEHLIPDLISNQSGKLLDLLHDLEPGRRSVLGWHHQAGLVLDFLILQIRLTVDAVRVTHIDVRQLQGEITAICLRVKDFPTETPKQALAVSELSRFIAGLLKIVYCELQQPTQTNVQTAVELLTQLVMPPDYKLSELAMYVQLYLNNLK